MLLIATEKTRTKKMMLDCLIESAMINEVKPEIKKRTGMYCKRKGDTRAEIKKMKEYERLIFRKTKKKKR